VAGNIAHASIKGGELAVSSAVRCSSCSAISDETIWPIAADRLVELDRC